MEGLAQTIEVSLLLILSLVFFSIGVGAAFVYWLFNRDDSRNIQNIRAYFREKAEEEESGKGL